MDILENREEWYANYHDGWLAHFRQTGQTDWKRYQPPQNREVPAGPGIKLSQSRLMLISSAGAYLRRSQPAFDAANQEGDYTIRTFPADTPLADLAFAHDHYDHTLVEQDPRIAAPLPYLQTLVQNGQIGELAASVVSFMGYQPDVSRVIDEVIPQILEIAQAEEVDGALLAPL